MRRIQTAVLLVSALCLHANAQAATLSGRTTNIFGVAVPAVAVEIRNSSTGVLLSAPVTSVSGDYSAVVPAGKYDITFAPAIASHVFGAVRNGFSVVEPATTLSSQLAPGQILSGRILTPAGAAVGHVALKFAHPVLGTPPANVVNAVTDDLGFVNALVTPGSWVVSGEPRIDQGIAPRILGTFDLTADRALGTALMLPGFVITGTIRSPLSAPLANAEFYVKDVSTGVELYTPTDLTDALGVATFVIPAGTYDIAAVPPLGPAFAARTRRQVVVDAALNLGDITLPSGFNLFARCVTAAGAPVTGVSCLVDSLPDLARLETPNNLSDAVGNTSIVVTPGPLRVSFLPGPATRLVPVAFDPLNVVGATDLGTVVLADGHLVSVTVREAGSGLPIAGANLDFVDPVTGATTLTPGDITDAAGFARVLTARSAYDLVVRSPSATWNSATIANFRTLNDTAVVVQLVNLSAAPPAQVSFGALAGAITACAPVQTLPVVLNRFDVTPIKAFSVTVQLSPELVASGGVAAFSDAGFMPNPFFNVLDLGNGLYTVDNAELGLVPCGVSSANGALFNIELAGGVPAGAGQVTITAVQLRDCANAPLAVSLGGPASVRIAAPLALTEAHLDVACFGASTGSIDLTVGGGTAPYSYLWSNAATTQDVALLGAGSYSVTVSDADGCTSSLSVAIAQPVAALALSETHVNLACFGASTGSIDLTVAGGTAPYTYLWSTGATSQDISGLTAGARSVTVTDSHGCTASLSVTLTQPAQLLATPSVTPVACFGGSTGALTLVVSGGTGVYSYLWSNAATTPNLAGLSAGSYSVTVTDANGCTTTASATVTQPAQLLAVATATPTGCFAGATGAVSLAVTGGTAPYTYLWNTGATSSALSGLAAGSYSVTVTDAHGCTATSAATVTQPTAALLVSEAHTTTCTTNPDGAIDVTVAGGTAPYTYAWNTGATTQDLAGLVAGTYSVAVTDAAGCSAALSVSVVLRAFSITASAGTGGSIAPAGVTTVGCGTSQAYTISASPGFHVVNVLLDGVTSLGPVNAFILSDVLADRTVAVSFALNAPVPALSALASAQLRKGNDTDGTTKIKLTWPSVAAGSLVEVWRAPFGNYPEYDDGPSPGGTPALPVGYPPAGWTLTAVNASGDFDEPASRDFWYYVAYVTDGFGSRSPVSNMTGGALNYHLGDVSSRVAGSGDNTVNTVDAAELGRHYGLSGAAVAAFAYLDVGPTTDFSATARPTTDNFINFDDLVVFAINYNPAVSTPLPYRTPALADVLTLEAPSPSAAGTRLTARLHLNGTGRVQALSAVLDWDPAVVRPVSYAAGELVTGLDGVVMSARPGVVDGAVFASTGNGFVGEGEFATVEFEKVAPGDPRIRISRVDARDVHNAHMDLATSSGVATPRETVFAPASPNPFAHATALAFALSERGPASLMVYSVDGRRVRTLLTGMQEPGEFHVVWDGSGDDGHAKPPGVYYARLTTSRGRFTRIVTLVR